MPESAPQSPLIPPPDRLFATPPEPERSFPVAAVTIASVAVVILLAILLLLGRRHPAGPPPNTLLPLAAYAGSLVLSDVQMSESTSLSGGKSTYIDGHIANHGPSTVTGVTAQVIFANDAAMPAQMETVPLNLIRTREPYIDTQPVSAAPLAPGGEADFRLIFESINPNWNNQPPVIRLTQVATH